MRLFLSLTSVLFVAAAASAAPRLYPAEIPLVGPRASHQLLLVDEVDGRAVADLTEKARFTSSNPEVAEVNEWGIVHVVGNGEATITATINETTAMAKVRVSGADVPVHWSFRHDVLPVLTKKGCNSGACHGALAGKGGMKLSLRGYDPESDHFVLTRQAFTRRVNGQEPERSLVLLKPTRGMKHGGGTKFDDVSLEYEILHDWIAAGAPGPRPEDPRLERLEVFPPSARLQPDAELRVLVRACYSDGKVEDVTRWARFGCSEETVARVDETGLVKVSGHGEAAVTIGFGTQVATIPVMVPFPNQVDAEVFAQSPRHNFIDKLILKKLQALSIAPSPGCDDATFIRRAYLDSLGVLPTAAEVQAFLADDAKNKRSRLIDQLLDRPEFVDYWTYKWSDLLLVSTRNLPQPAMWAFHRFIRTSVADNKPWDQFARELLTASGSTLHNGAGNYYVLHRDVAELTETTAVTFLGMSITCARCHNHPMEKWTQDQYWGLANLFSRVTLKDGERNGEVLIQPAVRGNILHPRRAEPMPPTPLDAEPMGLEERGDRRAFFAEWLTALNNPYFAKAVINRVWANYFGRGLVEAVDDLRATNPPSNQELFDELARDFVEHGYDLKRLMRLILNSAAYQRSAEPRPANQADDRFYSRFLIRRLPAEVILDAYAQVIGVPTPFNEIYTGVENERRKIDLFPLGMRALELPDVRIASDFLDTFGRPDRIQTCSCEREDDSSVGQALHLNNGKTLNQKLRAKDSRIDAWVAQGVSDAEAVERLFVLALARKPTDSEQERFAELLTEAEQDGTGCRQSLEDLFWAVLTSREFLFNH